MDGVATTEEVVNFLFLKHVSCYTTTAAMFLIIYDSREYPLISPSGRQITDGGSVITFGQEVCCSPRTMFDAKRFTSLLVAYRSSMFGYVLTLLVSMSCVLMVVLSSVPRVPHRSWFTSLSVDCFRHYPRSLTGLTASLFFNNLRNHTLAW